MYYSILLSSVNNNYNSLNLFGGYHQVKIDKYHNLCFVYHLYAMSNARDSKKIKEFSYKQLHRPCLTVPFLACKV